MEREQRKNGAAPAIDPDVARQQMEQFKASLFANAVKAVHDTLEQHKRAHGTDGLERATVAAAIIAFVHFINGNKKFVAGADTDALINIGIDVVSAAAVEAKRRADERRIIVVR